MTDIPEGVGSVGIDIKLMAPGYVVVVPDRKTGIPKGVSVALTYSLHEWLLKNPTYRVRASVGIVEDGETVIFHVWFDEEKTP